MKKLIILFLPLLLLGGISQAQDPAVTDAPTSKARRASKFQGLWQQRKGHNLRLEYGFQADLLGNTFTNKYTPLRFDLEYQYDIPWNPKRINFYAYAGIAYKQLDIDYGDYTYIPQNLWRLDLENGIGGYIGIGLKIHCTDWLHIAFSQAFTVMEKAIDITYYTSQNHLYPNGFAQAFIGSQTSFRIVGQINQFSVYCGYRVDHWQKTIAVMFPFNGLHENYLTFGIGYDF